jgi:hypothetical protein
LIKNERVKRAMMAVSRDSSTQPPHNHPITTHYTQYQLRTKFR